MRRRSAHSHPVLDLSPLAALPERFAANLRALCEEYAHLAPEELSAGRRRFAEEFLAREQLFYTPWGQALEARARRNLELMRNGG